jgi:hypothetical protein
MWVTEPRGVVFWNTRIPVAVVMLALEAGTALVELDAVVMGKSIRCLCVRAK